MRKHQKIWLYLLLGILLLVPCIPVSASEPLDEIEQETIWIDVQEDGSLDIAYEIDWKILDSTSDGPLSWVKLGIPNKYVEEIIPLSSSIKKIRYYGSGGDYVRLDLDREYEAGEIVNMKFSIHQHRMYREESGGYKYQFTPGWFDDISVKKLDIFWKYDKGTTSDMLLTSEKEAYYTRSWQNLAPEERVSVEVVYPSAAYQFHDDYKETAVSVWRYILKAIAAFFGVLGIIVYAAVLYAGRNRKGIKDSYEKNRGLGSAYTNSRYRTRGHTHGGGCACACACACAGGGRAGCSRKEFVTVHSSVNRNQKFFISGQEK